MDKIKVAICCRMFGYDRDPGMMSLFIDSNLYNLFANLNATNNSLIAQVEADIQNIKVYYDPSINPTRANVIDNKHVATFSGGTNYFPSDPDIGISICSSMYIMTKRSKKRLRITK